MSAGCSSARTSRRHRRGGRRRVRPRAWRPCDHCMDVGEARDVPQQRRKRRRRGATSSPTARGRAAGLDEALAQVHEVALDLRLARAAQVLAGDDRRRETDRRRRRRACARMISPYSSGNASSDRRNSSSGRMSGVAMPRARPARRQARARLEVRESSRLPTSARHVSGASRSPSSVRPVGHDRAQPVAEDAAAGRRPGSRRVASTFEVMRTILGASELR